MNIEQSQTNPIFFECQSYMRPKRERMDNFGNFQMIKKPGAHGSDAKSEPLHYGLSNAADAPVLMLMIIV